jgi:hypothetical protein
MRRHSPAITAQFGLVQQEIRNVALVVLIVAAMAALTSTRADALAYEDIAGKWCTSGGTENFDHQNLIAIPSSNHEQRVDPIVRYEFKDSTITVVWKNKEGKEVSTHFGEFSSDGHRMAQLASDAGPRREFHRCQR